MSLPLFAALSALTLIGASTALGSGRQPGVIVGWMLVAAPLVIFGAGYLNASSRIYPFGRDPLLVVSALSLSTLFVVLVAFMRPHKPAASANADLDGVELLDELFSQVERAERSEARVAELERQLSSYAPLQSSQERVPTRRTR
jgi:hypothetical protein